MSIGPILFFARRCRGQLSGLLWIASLLACASPVSAQPVDPFAALPESVRSALSATRLPAHAVAVVVQPLGPTGVSLAINETLPMNPASAMKLVTTYAALAILGPAYTWRTEAFTAGTLRRDVLDGDLVIRGGGDPKFVIEHLWLLVHRIRSFGIREIRGHVVLDRSAFAPLPHDPGHFDGERFRPYNAGPDALLVNYKAITLSFVPDHELNIARVIATPAMAGLKIPTSVRGLEGPCGDWRAKLGADFSNPLAPAFHGGYPLACGEQVWHISMLDHGVYFSAAFRALWENAGGSWKGKIREGTVPPDARRIAVHESAPLAEVIRDINKFSNNVMARQLFLTLGAERTRQAATAADANEAIRSWLAKQQLAMPELVMENGAGLSRIERISAGNLARLLVHAYGSPVMPEFMASLPIAGVDGTLRKRTTTPGYAHLKTGQLSDVRALAGYLLAVSGRRYALVVLINHANGGSTQAFQDALLDWLFFNG